MKSISIMSLLFVAVACSHVHASMITVSTPDDSFMNDLPVSARATFTTGTDSITVFLENLQTDPRSVTQNLSGLQFTVSTGQTIGTLTGSSGVPRWVAIDKTYTDGSAISSGWELGTIGAGLYLYVLGTAVGPAHTIIGPPDASDKYGNSNGSINDNGPHNPFLAESAAFVLNVPGVSDASSIGEVTFEFDTAPGSSVTVPEPATLTLLTLGGLAVLRRGRRR